MATVSELKTQIQDTLGYTIEDQKIISVFNECLKEDLAGVLRLETSATTEVVDCNCFAKLPNDMLELLMVKYGKEVLQKLTLDNENNKGYTLFGNAVNPINVSYPGTLRIYYYRYPALIMTINDTPDMPSEYHHALKYYFISKYHQEDEEPELEKSYLEDYLSIKAQINIHTSRQKGLYRTRKVRTQSFT